MRHNSYGRPTVVARQKCAKHCADRLSKSRPRKARTPLFLMKRSVGFVGFFGWLRCPPRECVDDDDKRRGTPKWATTFSDLIQHNLSLHLYENDAGDQTRQCDQFLLSEFLGNGDAAPCSGDFGWWGWGSFLTVHTTCTCSAPLHTLPFGCLFL
jgi:hypothetical protein